MIKKVFSVVLAVLLSISSVTVVSAEFKNELIEKVENVIISNAQAARESSLPFSDWLSFGLSRFGSYDKNGSFVYKYADGEYDEYLKSLKASVEQKYKDNSGVLSSTPTDYFRTIVTAASLGGDVTDFGTYNNNKINLLADGIFNNKGIAKQGINGYIWALTALDSEYFSVPKSSLNTRKNLISSICKFQLSDGSWAWFGNDGDPDLTAMAIIALAPYYYSTDVYTFVSAQTSKAVTTDVYSVINKAVSALASFQNENGAIVSWGTANSCSTAEVLMALCTVGIDISTDTRFVKADKTLFDALMTFNCEGKGFSYSDGVTFDSYSNDNVTYAIVSYYRFLNGMRTVFDIRSDISDNDRKLIDNAEKQIASIDKNLNTTVNRALFSFNAVPKSEQRYVNGANILISALNKLNPCRFGHKFGSNWIVDKKATYFECGYKSHHCTVCGERTSVTKIAKITLEAPSLKLTSKNSKLIAKASKVKSAQKYCFSIKSKKGKWKNSTYKSATHTFKNLKKNTKYYIRVRAVVSNGKKTAFSGYSKIRSLKCK